MENNFNQTERKTIPNNAFDIEYRTEWRDEVDFLAARGIYYTIRKKEGEYQIPVYKYTKTADLFIALADFYMRRKRNLRSLSKYNPNARPEQLSFVNKDGTLNEKFDNEKSEKVNQFKPTEAQIEKAKKILEAAAEAASKEEEPKEEPKDDTE